MQFTGGLNGAQPASCGLLWGDASIEGVVDVLEHQAHGGVHICESQQLRSRQGPDVGVREQSPGKGLLTGPAGECDEVGEPATVEAPADMRQGVGDLTGQEEDLGGLTPHGDVEEAEEFVRCDQAFRIGSVAAVGALPRAIVGQGNGDRRAGWKAWHAATLAEAIRYCRRREA